MDECARERSAHKAYKKECNALKAEYNIIRLKVCVVVNVLSSPSKVYHDSNYCCILIVTYFCPIEQGGS